MTSLKGEFKTKGKTESGQDVGEFREPDLSSQDQAEHTAQMTARAYESTKLIEIVEVKAAPGQVHLLGRVQRNNEKTFMEKVALPTLKAMTGDEADGHLCKQFFLKNGSLRYGWCISFASNNLKGTAYKIAEALEPVAPRLEVMEAPLQGAGTPQSGGQTTGRRGAAPVR